MWRACTHILCQAAVAADDVADAVARRVRGRAEEALRVAEHAVAATMAWSGRTTRTMQRGVETAPARTTHLQQPSVATTMLPGTAASLIPPQLPSLGDARQSQGEWGEGGQRVGRRTSRSPSRRRRLRASPARGSPSSARPARHAAGEEVGTGRWGAESDPHHSGADDGDSDLQGSRWAGMKRELGTGGRGGGREGGLTPL